jgi:signal transduction histidine kinase
VGSSVSEAEQGPSASELLEALRRSPALVALVRGPDYVYEYANEAYVAAARLGPNPVGKPFGASSNDGSTRTLTALRDVFATGEPWEKRELRLELPGPGGKLEECYFDVRFLPVRHDGVVRKVLIHSYDVTALVQSRQALAEELLERKRAEAERAALHDRLLQVQKAESLSVLAGGVAHDFNNMLMAIMGSISVAFMQVSSGTPLQALLGEALDGTRRAADLTRQLLTFAGHTRAEKRPVDLSNQVREMAHLFEKALPPGVSLSLELGSGLPAVEADPGQLQQVVMNLIINAGEAIERPIGVVSVATGALSAAEGAAAVGPSGGARAEQYLFLDVTDDGRGMEQATVGRIFDPFFSTKDKGAAPRGLGLASVAGIVRAHGGAIHVETAPGKGTTFRVVLPASRGASRSPTSPRPPSDWQADGQVLIVDDDPFVRAATRRLLEMLGFTVHEAPEGPTALRLVSELADLRVVLLDATMPRMAGEEVLRELRRLRSDLPVVVVSGDAEGAVMKRFEPDRPEGWLAKPFTVAELTAALERVLPSDGAP